MTPAASAALADRARQLGAGSPCGSLGALAAAAVLTTTSSIQAARKALTEIERPGIRHQAARVIDQLLKEDQ
jgi:hypothetical protein